MNVFRRQSTLFRMMCNLFWRKKLCKDTHVSMCDYLIGDDYEEVQCPNMPNGLQKEIRSRKMTSFLWHMMVKQKIENVSFIQDNYKKDYFKTYGALWQLLMFIMMYPKTNDDLFIETLLERCDHFKKYQREPHTL